MTPPGLTIVYTGNGKGKTTAALGLAIRAAAAGKKVAIVQFVKSPAASGEVRLFKRLRLPITIHASGLGFVGIYNDRHTKAEHAAAARAGLRQAKRWLKDYDVVILDEVNGALHARLLKTSDVVSLIAGKPRRTTLVLTGRMAPQSLIRRADLVTEMKEIKHPYTKGWPAQPGIDY